MTPSNLDRRQFVRIASAASLVATAPSLAGQPSPIRFTFANYPIATMPLDFTGLSYESPQLANPAFFSPENTGLVKLFRELTPPRSPAHRRQSERLYRLARRFLHPARAP